MEEDLQEAEATFEAQTRSFVLMERLVWEHQRCTRDSLRENGARDVRVIVTEEGTRVLSEADAS